jgi:hypothetical protein
MEKKDVLSYWFQREEEGCAEKLFHSRVKIQDKACALTIDRSSFINAVSLEMVEKLELLTVPLQQPYLLRLGNNELAIAHQASVHFQLGPLSYEVCCDVIPIHMVSCHLMLGIPWNKQHGAVLNQCNPPQYAMPFGKKVCILKSMDTNIYTSWREKRLQNKKADEKMRELEEAKKREAQTAAIPVVADTALDLVPIQPTSKDQCRLISMFQCFLTASMN